MGRIKIEVDTLRNYASTVGGRISECEALNTRMSNLSSSITASWEGDAKRSYEAMMNGYIQQGTALIEILKKFQGYAQQAADLFDNVDSQCAARIRGSF